MHCKQFAHRGLLLMLVVLLCSLRAKADSTSDPCSPTTACSATCKGSSCAVVLNRSGGTLSPTYNGSDASALCAPNSSTVTWATATATPASVVGVLFSSTHYPGSSSIVVGTSNSSNGASSSVTASGPAQVCYVYSVEVCVSQAAAPPSIPRSW